MIGETGTGSISPQGAALGILAAGSAALSLWRKDFEK
jgi:hypothetical protein